MKLALLGAAALAATALVSAAKAQPVVSDPGYCAQFYPNANCQNWGPGNPYHSSQAQDWGNRYAYMGTDHTRSHHVYRHHYR